MYVYYRLVGKNARNRWVFSGQKKANCRRRGERCCAVGCHSKLFEYADIKPSKTVRIIDNSHLMGTIC